MEGEGGGTVRIGKREREERGAWWRGGWNCGGVGVSVGLAEDVAEERETVFWVAGRFGVGFDGFESENGGI